MTSGDTLRLQICLMIRFSYPALSGFSRTGEDAAANARLLYDRDRLAYRFHLFEALTVPSLCAQTDPDYVVGVLIGDDLPNWAFKRLRAALAPLPQARIIVRPAGPHYGTIQTAFSELRDRDASHIVTVRLDDDDALCRSYIERLRPLAAMMAAQKGWLPKVIAFNRGFYLDLGDRPDLYDVCERMPLGIGAAMVTPIGQREMIFRRDHRALTQFYTSFLDAELPAFIRTVHQHNDSHPHRTGHHHQLTASQIDTELSANFPFDRAQLLALAGR